MKHLIKASFLALAVLAALAGCELYNAINVAWTIDNVTWLGDGYTRVDYTAQNMGRIDLAGVNLQIGVDVAGTGFYPSRAWTQDFALNQNQVIVGSLDVFTGSNPGGGATVLSIDMDDPVT